MDIVSLLIGKKKGGGGGGTGPDTSDATATPKDILEKKTAYLSDGQRHQGTMKKWNGEYIGNAISTNI